MAFIGCFGENFNCGRSETQRQNDFGFCLGASVDRGCDDRLNISQDIEQLNMI